MANNLSLKLIIDGTATGALKALGQVQSGVTGVEKQIKGLQDLGRNALQFAGVGLGISELIRLAEPRATESLREPWRNLTMPQRDELAANGR